MKFAGICLILIAGLFIFDVYLVANFFLDINDEIRAHDIENLLKFLEQKPIELLKKLAFSVITQIILLFLAGFFLLFGRRK